MTLVTSLSTEIGPLCRAVIHKSAPTCRAASRKLVRASLVVKLKSPHHLGSQLSKASEGRRDIQYQRFTRQPPGSSA